MSNFANIYDASFRNGISCSVSLAVPSRLCVGITLAVSVCFVLTTMKWKKEGTNKHMTITFVF